LINNIKTDLKDMIGGNKLDLSGSG